jgi:hypothetical protein
MEKAFWEMSITENKSSEHILIPRHLGIKQLYEKDAVIS